MREERKIWNGVKFISGKMVGSDLAIHGVYVGLSHDVKQLTAFGDDLIIYQLFTKRLQFRQSKGRTKVDELILSGKQIIYFWLSVLIVAGNDIVGVYMAAVLNRKTTFLLVLFWTKLPQLPGTSIKRVEQNSYILSDSSYRNNLYEILLETEFEFETAKVHLKLQPCKHTSLLGTRYLQLIASYYRPSMVKRHNHVEIQLLVQWSNLCMTILRWEDYSVLKSQISVFDPWGQGSSAGGSIVMTLSEILKNWNVLTLGGMRKECRGNGDELNRNVLRSVVKKDNFILK
ncbi:hypothetical protein GQ457_08G013340 [Hibiscus cannabinus]